MTRELVTKKAAAKHFGVSTQALDGWFTAGCPVEERDGNGAIKSVSLRGMTIWRDYRKQWADMSASERERLMRLFDFTCEVMAPALIRDVIANIEEIAREAEVPVAHAKAVWAISTNFAFITIGRVFAKYGDDVKLHLSELVVRETKAIGDAKKAKAKSNPDSPPQ